MKIKEFLVNLKEFQVENETDVKKMFNKRAEEKTNPFDKSCPIAEILTTVYGVCTLI